MADSTPRSTAKKAAGTSPSATTTAAPTRTATKTTTTKTAPRTAAVKKATPKKATPKKAAVKKAATQKTSAVAAAADRAGGERARRRSTPLISAPVVEVAEATKTTKPTKTPTTKSPKGAAKGATRTTKRPATSSGASRTASTRTPALRVVHGPDGSPPVAQRSTARRRPPVRRSTGPRPATPIAAVPEQPTSATPESGQAVVPGLAELLSVLLSAGQLTSRTLGQAAGAAAGAEWERRFAETLEFLQRRVRGDYRVDDFGFDEDFTIHTVFPVLRLLKDKWFRVEVRGIENIPDEGGALLVSNHSGTVAIDSVITQLAIHDAHPRGRFLRMLGADLVFQLPVVGDFARKTGATLASNADAERLLRGGELVGVWPEGFKGVGKPFRERYKLQRFGRGGFVSAAIRSEVPIIPCSVIGAEEVYPMIGNMKTVARLIGAPYAPITPFFPLLGPLGLIPLPSKWIIEFGEPVDTASLGPAAAEDPMLVFELTDQVRETIQQTLYSVLVTRRSVFF